GSNPGQVTQQLEAAYKGYRKSGVLCTLKHFPGLGSASANTDFNAADVTHTWTSQELIPYRNLIQHRTVCPFIMVAHIINRQLDPSGKEASLSKKIITGILRQQFHYQGIIITDDMDAVAIRHYIPTQQAIRLALLAGNNMMIYGGIKGQDPTLHAK